MVSWGGRERNAGLSLNIAISIKKFPLTNFGYKVDFEKTPVIFQK